MRKIYLDNHATTQCDPQIVELVSKILSNQNLGNPHSSEHDYGWQANKIIEDSAEIVANYLNCLSSEIYFTSGATESNNIAILGTIKNAIKKTKRRKILISEVEHKCVIEAAVEAADRYNLDLQFIPVNTDGVVCIDSFKRILDKNTLLVSVMHTNNETGVIQPIADIGQLCGINGSIFHVDASQGFYSVIDVAANSIDLLSMSGHKFYAPVGVGLLFVNGELAIKPTSVLVGGYQQEGMRSGTISVALVASLARALELIKKSREEELQHLVSLRKRFLNNLESGDIKFKINGCMQDRHPGNLNLQLMGVDAAELIYRMQPYVALSTGSACSSGTIKDSHVLKAMGLSRQGISQSLRVGFGRFNNQLDIDSCTAIIKQNMA